MNLEDLKEELLEIAIEWYANSSSQDSVSDLEFDEKENAIKKLDPDWDYRLHLYEAGTDVKHHYPMIKVAKMQEVERSMDEVFEDMNSKVGSINAPKYDGGGIALYYREGVLFDAITRSSQMTGKSQLTKMMSMVPLTLEDKDIVAIECEAVCSKDKGFGDLARQNACGLLNSNSMQEKVEENLTVIAFKVRFKNEEEMDWVKATKALPTLKKGNNITFMPTPFNEGVYSGNKFTIGELEFLIDGIVEFHDGESLAHKLYYNDKKDSVIEKLEYNHTPSSLKYVPKYIYESVNIDGTECSRATASGTAEMKSKKAGVGAKVEIIKSGLTIPQVFRVKAKEMWYIMNCSNQSTSTFMKNDCESRGLEIKLSTDNDFWFSFYADYYTAVKVTTVYHNHRKASLTAVAMNAIMDTSVVEFKDIPKKLKITKYSQEHFDFIYDEELKSTLVELKEASSFYYSENYSLPTQCECGYLMDWKDELNGGLYCANSTCKVNLKVLETQLENTGLKLSDLITNNPIKFINEYFKCPRFGGLKKLKTSEGKSLESFSYDLLHLPKCEPHKVLSDHFHLSGLQNEVVEKLDKLIAHFIKKNL